MEFNDSSIIRTRSKGDQRRFIEINNPIELIKRVNSLLKEKKIDEAIKFVDSLSSTLFTGKKAKGLFQRSISEIKFEEYKTVYEAMEKYLNQLAEASEEKNKAKYAKLKLALSDAFNSPRFLSDQLKELQRQMRKSSEAFVIKTARPGVLDSLHSPQNPKAIN